MPLVMNGVIIPENVANAFMFNGVSVTDVFMDGVQVWNQNLFSGSWSGSSLVNGYGLTTSGPSYKWTNGYNDTANWLSATSIGLASGDSVTASVSYGFIRTTANSFQMRQGTVEPYGTILFSTVSKFSGVSEPAISHNWSFMTSGGLIRFDYNNGTFGPWVSLN